MNLFIMNLDKWAFKIQKETISVDEFMAAADGFEVGELQKTLPRGTGGPRKGGQESEEGVGGAPGGSS